MYRSDPARCLLRSCVVFCCLHLLLLLGHERGRRQITQARMWSHVVEMPPPRFDDDPRLRVANGLSNRGRTTSTSSRSEGVLGNNGQFSTRSEIAAGAAAAAVVRCRRSFGRTSNKARNRRFGSTRALNSAQSTPAVPTIPTVGRGRVAGDAIDPIPTVMLQRRDFSKRATCRRTKTRTIRRHVLSGHIMSLVVGSKIAAVHHAGGGFL